MRAADSNGTCLLLHAALVDSYYSYFQATFDEVDLYGSDTERSYNQIARTRMTPNTAALAPV